MPSKQLAWEVREVEVAGRASWHTSREANHGHSQSFNRYLFDLELLERDRRDMPDNPHVLYYLGVRRNLASGTWPQAPGLSPLAIVQQRHSVA
jgi:hypothetical protein